MMKIIKGDCLPKGLTLCKAEASFENEGRLEVDMSLKFLMLGNSEKSPPLHGICVLSYSSSLPLGHKLHEKNLPFPLILVAPST